jgi:hypothetical protein
MYSYWKISKAAGFPTCGPQCRDFMNRHYGIERTDDYDLAVEIGKAFLAHKKAIATSKGHTAALAAAINS